ncbi:unnamed protein product [Rotaria socialis]|uniref:Uncharacterized protein n=1 Tax=Rotaria socialis TaxID=392032 RepID=A0A820AK22_9BILA|nr:unnamed protein product [Rotaria socialis]CAF3194805.1 unnamed protein product [Rotaria socialis]CAF4186737.1 unnamed protein product [Rotaria socialis]CAF4236107.1 unnamed protein product [Rotaria socialis]
MANYELSLLVPNIDFDDILHDKFSHVSRIKPIIQGPNVFSSTSLVDAVKFVLDNIIGDGSYATSSVPIVNQENHIKLQKAYMLFNKDNTINGPLFELLKNELF